MNERLNELMLKAGYAAPYLAGRAHTLAALIIEECAAIAGDCYTYNEPLSKVPDHIKKFERLTDDNMSHKVKPL